MDQPLHPWPQFGGGPVSATVDELTRALSIDKANVSIRLSLSRALSREGQSAEALRVLEEGLQYHPHHLSLTLALAEGFLALGKTEAALLALEDLSQRHPSEAAPYELRVRLYLERAHYAEALSTLRAAWSVQPAPRLDRALCLEVYHALIHQGLGAMLSSEEAELAHEDDELDDGLDELDESHDRPDSDARPPRRGQGAGRPDRDPSRALWHYLHSMSGRDGGAEGPGALPEVPTRRVPPPRPLEQIAGLETVKEPLLARIAGLSPTPELDRVYGPAPGPGGVLLYGPPGCGKSLLMRSMTLAPGLAMSVALSLQTAYDLAHGTSPKEIGECFESARRRAPALILLDELDGIAPHRRQATTSGHRLLIAQLMDELDALAGMAPAAGQRAGRVMVLAASGAPWLIEPGLLRPGRLGQMVFVPPPDEAARLELLTRRLAGVPGADELSLEALVKGTHLFSAADIEAVIDQTLALCRAEATRAGRVVPMTEDRLLSVAARTRPSTGGWFRQALTQARAHNHDGHYDGLLAYIERTRK